jgi:hypothetical protein
MQISFVYHNYSGLLNIGDLLQIPVLRDELLRPQDMDKKSGAVCDPPFRLDTVGPPMGI